MTDREFLFDEDEEPEAYSALSREDQLRHYMAGIGFLPKEPMVDSTFEFSKTFTDPDGRAARIVAVIGKDQLGLEPTHVKYLTVTIQVMVDGTEESANEKCPAFARPDVLRVLAHFDTREKRVEAETVKCSLCGTSHANVIERNGEMVCHDCARRKGRS